MNLLTELLSQIERSSFLFVVTCILLVMVFIFMVIFCIAYKRNLDVQKNIKTMESEYHQNIVSSNIKILEEERQRFVQDLHDEIGSSLSAIKLYVSNIDRATHDDELKDQLRNVKQTIDQSMASTRRIAYNLLPPRLEDIGLHVLYDLLDSLKGLPVKINMEIQEDQPRLNYQTELNLYRIVQELLGNTLKHAEATDVFIQLSFDDSHYKIQYTDNGIGFEEPLHYGTGMGLVNVKSRAAIIGGQLSIQTAPQAGFKASLAVPLVKFQ